MPAFTRGLRAASTGLMGVIFLFSLLGSGSTVSAAGTTIPVDTFADDLTVNGNCTLREAIKAANTDTAVDACPAGNGADTIPLLEGTYLLSLVGELEDAGLTGDLDIFSTITITGAGRGKTFIDGGGVILEDRVDRVIDVQPDGDLTLQDATLQHGSVLHLAEQILAGGGGLHNQGKVHLIWVNILENFLSMYEWGAGFHNEGTALLEHVLIAGNWQEFDGVGGIYNQGDLTYQYGTIEDNSGDQGRDVLFNDVKANASFDQVTIQHAVEHGGTHIINKGTLTIERSLLTDLYGDFDPVLSNQVGAVVFIRETTIQGNTADYGSLMSNSGEMWIENSFVGNNADVDNDTVYLQVKAGETHILNSTFTGNSLQILGGTVSVNGVTMAKNETGLSSIEMTGGALSITNSLLAESYDESGNPIADCSFEGGTFTSLGGNLVGIASGCDWVAGPGDQLGTIAQPIVPLLGPLNLYGGTTSMFSLLKGSPAIDAGSDTHCLPTDQRGVTRPQDGDGDGVAQCDIGAYEVPSATLPPSLFLPVILR